MKTSKKEIGMTSRFEYQKQKILHSMTSAAYKLLRPFRLSFEARLIEYDFVASNINAVGSKQKVLDIGCYGSPMPIELANKGHEVYGIDVHDYLNPQSFNFIKGDIERMPFHDNFFDTVSAVSTIEHIGLGYYGDPLSSIGDKNTMEEIMRVLKLGGKLLVTIPSGSDTIAYLKEGVPAARVYSPDSLVELLKGFKLLEVSYIVKSNGLWLPASINKASEKVVQAANRKSARVSIALIVATNQKR